MHTRELPTSIRKKDSFGSPEFLKHFANIYPGEYIYLQPILISKILEEIGQSIVDEIINGEAIKFAFGVGNFMGVTKSQSTKLDENNKPVNLKIDPVATKKLWESNPELNGVQCIYFLNDDLTYNAFKWDKSEIRISTNTNVTFYKFKPVRTAARAMAAISKNGKRYIGEKLKIR